MIKNIKRINKIEIKSMRRRGSQILCPSKLQLANNHNRYTGGINRNHALISNSTLVCKDFM